MKRSVRRDQRNYIDNLPYQAEKAANKGNLKELFAITRILSKRQIQRNQPIRNKDGTLLTNTEEQLKHWQEHSSKILNPSLDKQADEEEEYEKNLRIKTKVPTVVEIKKALKELQNGKAAGVNNISPEVMKVDLNITANMLYALFDKIWNEGEMPNDWRCGLLIKISKKGDRAKCNNWRGITLLSVQSKVFTRVLLNRIKEHVNQRLRKEQAGFRPNRSCIDQINTLWIIIKQCIEWTSCLYTVFVNFKKAFDSINRKAMWKEVKRYGMPSCTRGSSIKANFCAGRSEARMYPVAHHVVLDSD